MGCDADMFCTFADCSVQIRLYSVVVLLGFFSNFIYLVCFLCCCYCCCFSKTTVAASSPVPIPFSVLSQWSSVG